MTFKYSYMITLIAILIVCSIGLMILYAFHHDIGRFLGQCFAGLLIALIFAFTSMPVYHLSMGGVGVREGLFLLQLAAAIAIVYVSSTATGGYTIVGTHNDPAIAAQQSFFAGLFLSAIGLLGMLTDLFFIEKQLRLLLLIGIIPGHIIIVYLYSSQSILPVIICAIVARDMLSVFLHRAIKQYDSPVIQRISVAIVGVSLFLLPWVSILALN